MSLLASTLVTFALAALATVAAGTFLARAGDVIAARTKLGRVWVGSIFLAFATSLPELTTDISAVRIGALDLAAGDLFGSSMANMLILAVIALLPRGRELFRRAALDHAVYAAVAIGLTSIAAIGVLSRASVTIGSMGIAPTLILLLYLAGSRTIFRHTAVAPEAAATAELQPVPPGDAAPERVMSLRGAIGMAVGAAAVILIAAPQFARAAETLAEMSGMGSTFVGTLLVGLSTSLPELVTSLAAARIGAFDLAVGNLFGSNAFNMTVFAVLDVVQGPGAFFALLSPVHAVSGLTAIALMAVAIMALVARQGRGDGGLPASLLMVLGYLLGLAALYGLR